MKEYTGEDAYNILVAFSNEFIMDIKAIHTEIGSGILYNDLEYALMHNQTAWYDEVASAATARALEWETD